MAPDELLRETPSFEEFLKTLRTRLSQACRGKPEFGGSFNKFLKGEPAFISSMQLRCSTSSFDPRCRSGLEPRV
jgi:hypothetical protein